MCFPLSASGHCGGSTDVFEYWQLTISNQLEAGSIIVRHIKSIWDPSLPLRVYGPMRSTHNASHGVMMTSFGGNFPYFNFRRLLVWQDRHLLTYDRIVVRILFQYIAARKSLQDESAQGVEGNGDTMQLPGVGEISE